METIKKLFDKSRDIYRTIEKVITYGAAQEARLKSEIGEYIVTESIEEQLEKLLVKMQAAMEAGDQHEIGVWVSGFYGSGKSSITKYLGLALDSRVTIDGIPFLQHLQNRLHKPQTRALLATVARRFPAAVVLLDLASEMLAGATMEDVSTVLYFKTLQWAGYSRNLKVAALERRLQKDGRYADFLQRIRSALDLEWTAVQNDPLVVDSLIPEIAHAIYPEIFPTVGAFSTDAGDYVRFENERVAEMISIVRETSSKEYILFIVDEVGQYVGSRPNLILNLDGLAKNLKNIGNGKVWIVGTAQQTLTEDDPRAAFNSPELYKLKDRFPIQIDLESRDIKEICYRRLLGKSPEGETLLGKIFDQQSPALKHHTRLQNARYYDSDFDRKTFVDLYPFLPAHFEILLHLLGALAKSTGGFGLRSAIKIVQDILIEGNDGRPPVAERQVGWLATTPVLYDALEKDIRRAFPSIHQAVGKTPIRFPGASLHLEIAKTAAVLQILANLPVTMQNLAGLMHPSIESSGLRQSVEQAVREMIGDPHYPLGEKEGQLHFFSEKLSGIDVERSQIPLRSMETRRIFHETLRETFQPLPSARLHGTVTVSAGVRLQSGAQIVPLAGEREPVQILVELAAPDAYDTLKARLLEESRTRGAQNTLFLPARALPEIDGLIAEIYRCREIGQRYRNDPDQEIKEYCTAQADRALRLIGEIQHLLRRSLLKGSFLFRGQTTAIESIEAQFPEAVKKFLASAAEQIFDRYAEAPLRAETNLAEGLLRLGNLNAVTAQTDPFGLVQIQGGKPSIRTDAKALVSIRDYLDRNGTVEGKKLIDDFGDAPYGWSPDTLRYLIAVLLLAGEIKLKVAGREVTVNGQQAIDALKTNNSFRPVGVSLRTGRPSLEVLALAARRLTELAGDTVIPLENEISKSAAKHLPRFHLMLGPLGEKLATMELPGVERVRSLGGEMAELLFSDASEAPVRLGSPNSTLFENLQWAIDVHAAFQNGLEATIRSLQQHRRGIAELPDSGIPGALRRDLAEDLTLLSERLQQDGFHRHAADLNTMLTALQSRIAKAVAEMTEAQQREIRPMVQELRLLPEWAELTQEEQSNALAQLETLTLEVEPNLDGLRQLLNREFVLRTRLSELKGRIVEDGRRRRLARIQEEKEKGKKEGKSRLIRTVELPAVVTDHARLQEVIVRLQAIQADAAIYNECQITLTLHVET